MINKIKYFILGCVLLPFIANAQKAYEATGDTQVAQQFFVFGAYATALKKYQYLQALDSTKPEFF